MRRHGDSRIPSHRLPAALSTGIGARGLRAACSQAAAAGTPHLKISELHTIYLALIFLLLLLVAAAASGETGLKEGSVEGG